MDDLGGDTSYFNDTALAAETPLEPAPTFANEPVAEAAPEEPKSTSNEIAFNLDGMDMPDMAVPNTIPRPAAAEPPAQLASIDFDFLDEPKAKEEPSASDAALTLEPATPEQNAQIAPIADLEFSLDDLTPQEKPENKPVAATTSFDMPPLELEIPGLEETRNEDQAKAETATDPMDFDLSGISLELNPTAANGKSDFMLDSHDDLAMDGDGSAGSAEMATKLDLAIAYQEIGDKEGARELLDEVLKGGTPEQSEKAKSLLLELA